MKLDILSRAEAFFDDNPPGKGYGAFVLRYCMAVADAVPPSSYYKADRLHGESLRDIFYLHVNNKGHSGRIYFYCEADTLFVLHIIEAKRRTNLTEGQIEQLEHALREAKMKIQRPAKLH